MTPWTPEYHLMGRVAALRLLGGGGFDEGSPPDPEPPPPDPPAPGTIVGFGVGATGGGASVTHTVNANASDAWTRYKTLVLEAGSAQRNIEIIGNNNIDELREAIHVKRPNLTVHGELWPGQFIRGHQRFSGSNLRLEHLAFIPGDDVVKPDDCDGLTLNPGSGAGDFLDNFLLYHITALGGPDIGGIAVLNGCRNGTVQECMTGLGLYLSRHSEATLALNGHSKGFTFTQIGQAVEHPSNITVYRHFNTTSTDRNPHVMNVDHIDLVNAALYNHGKFTTRWNSRGNIEGTMVKIGPDTTNHEALIMSGTNQTVTTAIPSSIFLGGNTGIGNNLVIDGSQVEELTAGVRRTSRYGTISVEPDTADAALFASVVNGSGRNAAGALELALKAHAIAGTSDGFMNGIDGPPPTLGY